MEHGVDPNDMKTVAYLRVATKEQIDVEVGQETGEDADGEESDSEEPEWRWCLVGNIVQSHPYGEEKEIKYGTKCFSGGTKVYIAPPQWGDGFENVCVIGKPRHSRGLIEIVIKSDYIENCRLKKVFAPNVLKRMAASQFLWWDQTDEDKETIVSLAESMEHYRQGSAQPENG